MCRSGTLDIVSLVVSEVQAKGGSTLLLALVQQQRSKAERTQALGKVASSKAKQKSPRQYYDTKQLVSALPRKVKKNSIPMLLDPAS